MLAIDRKELVNELDSSVLHLMQLRPVDGPGGKKDPLGFCQARHKLGCECRSSITQ